MTAFVLVPGAWLGGWCWKRVVALLRAAGHEAFTPTLTGLGERRHLGGPQIGLATHIQDVVGVLESEDLEAVVLVGHSYGGMVITGVAERAAARLAHLVYLDAAVPKDGQAVMDLLLPEERERYRTEAQARGQGWRIPPEPLERFGVTAEADLRWATPRLAGQPLKSFEEALPIPGVVPVPPRTFIYCSAGRPPERAERLRARFSQEQGWRYRELATGHCAMITAPVELAALLLELA